MPPTAPLPDELPRSPRGGALPDLLTVSDPRDLVALVPYRLGFRPWDSLVLLCLRGQRPRVGLVMRVDLPDDENLATVVAHLARHATNDGANAAVAVVYRDEAVSGRTEAVVAEVLASHGVVLKDAWQVGRDSYWSLTCTDPACCPPEGWPVETLDSRLISAEMVARGRVVARSRGELAGDLRPVDDARRARVAVLAVEHAQGRPVAPAIALTGWRRAGLAAWRGAMAGRSGSWDGPDVTEPVAGVLLGAMTDRMVRDALLLDCVPGMRSAADQLVRGRVGETVARALDAVFAPRGDAVPDEERLDRADRLLQSLVRQADGGMRAAPLGLMAWSAWWSGDGGRGSVVVDLALAAEPGHRLALLISSVLDAGVAPGWVRQSRQSEAAT